MEISICNRIDGTVADMKKGTATTSVRLKTNLGEVTLVITSSSVEELALTVDDRVSALFREVDVMLMTGSGAISTGNRFSGRILDIKRGGVTVELALDLGKEQRIVAVVARTAAEEMGLGLGQSVTACVREGDLILDKGGALSIRNRLAGTISNLRPGTVTTEVSLDTSNGSLQALLARSAADEMGLAVGQRVITLVRERDFMIQR
jgi:molybdate transport system regulatory protein